MFIPMAQQYEETENNRVSFLFFVEIQKNIPCKVVSVLGFLDSSDDKIPPQ